MLSSINRRLRKILKLFAEMNEMPVQKNVKNAVEKVIDGKVRPHLAMHGGDIELVDVKDGVAIVKLRGACIGCPMAAMTLKGGVEREIIAAVPQIKRVDAV